MTQTDLNSLVTISNKIGNRADYVQGGGGNTSVKLDSQKMSIKASGYLLSDMTLDNGYSTVDYNEIRKYVISPDSDEDVFTNKIKSLVIETEERPSIETGFHALLGKFVIHTHSVYANILTCSTEGEEISKHLFPNSSWINYDTPGRGLTMKVYEKLQEGSDGKVAFLENHGLVISEQSADKCFDLHEKVNRLIRDHFTHKTKFDISKVVTDLEFCSKHVLFPDQVVFTLAGEKLLNSKSGIETLAAYEYISSSIKELGLTHHYLKQEQVDHLTSLESEKFRQKRVKKK